MVLGLAIGMASNAFGGSKSVDKQKVIQEVIQKSVTRTSMNVINKTMTETSTEASAENTMYIGAIDCDVQKITQNAKVSGKVLMEIKESNVTDLQNSIKNDLENHVKGKIKKENDPLDWQGLFKGMDQDMQTKVLNEIENIVSTTVNVQTVTSMKTSLTSRNTLYVGAGSDMIMMAEATDKICSVIRGSGDRLPFDRGEFLFPDPTIDDYEALSAAADDNSSPYEEIEKGESGSGIEQDFQEGSGSGAFESVPKSKLMYSNNVKGLHQLISHQDKEDQVLMWNEIYDEMESDGILVNEEEKSTIKRHVMSRISGSMSKEAGAAVLAAASSEEVYIKAVKEAEEKCIPGVKFYEHARFQGRDEWRDNPPLKINQAVNTFHHGISSAKVPDGCYVTIYDQPNGRGLQYSFTSDQGDFNTDLPSSGSDNTESLVNWGDKTRSAKVSTKEVDEAYKVFLEKAEENKNNKKTLTRKEKYAAGIMLRIINNKLAQVRRDMVKEYAKNDAKLNELVSECVQEQQQVINAKLAQLKSITGKVCEYEQNAEVNFLASMIGTKVSAAVMESEVFNEAFQKAEGGAENKSTTSTIFGGIGDMFGKIFSGPMLILIGFLAILFLVFMMFKSG